ncbi:MAG: 1-deoxy-D-xylulose-5-phosphate reductoisomerase, partial [Synergistetes bacterium]|nr:1-deoxy-D-xylulose-5-phosphate reductoisomerase [Synergistota bacterium]
MAEIFQKKGNKLHGNSNLPLRLAVLGATGSIGKAVISVKRAFPELIELVALTGGRNVDSMFSLVKELSPKRVGMVFKDAAEKLEKILGSRVYAGEREALIKIWKDFDDIDAIVVCVVGIAGFLPTYEALRLGKKVFLSTKEALVVGGEFIVKEVKSRDQLIPLDSEHWAIFSCIDSDDEVEKVYLTASGGALRDFSHDERKCASARDVLNHPVWKMGRRITVDSATLMNKGFEVIEASWLFNLPPGKVKVIIHREAWIHGVVEFLDGSLKAFVSYPDMRLVV